MQMVISLYSQAARKYLFSHLWEWGMVTQEIKVGNQRVFNISLELAAESLDELVVTGYQTISRERATGSYNIIGSDQIEKPALNIGQRIIGTSSGVQSTTD